MTATVPLAPPPAAGASDRPAPSPAHESAPSSPIATATKSGTSAAATKPVPTGLEHLSDEWPKWAKVGVQYRGRAEATDGLSGVNGRDDGYYLTRIRLDASFVVSPAFRFVTQAQDAQALAYDGTTTPTSLANTFDLRLAYADLQTQSRSGIGLRVGRQELAFGEQRLIGIGEWNNTARVFDAVRGTMFAPRARLDAFAATLVRVEQGRFDRHRTDERLFGAVASLQARVIRGVIEPYVFIRRSDAVAGELGDTGEGHLYTSGVRVAGALRRLDVGAEIVLQRGTAAATPLAAWAGHYAAGWILNSSPRKPRIFTEFNVASGDDAPRDGRRGTFDQLYPTNHAKYGLVDQVGWRNMRDVAAGFEFAPTPKARVTSTMHQLWLATANDGLYNAAGVRTVLNPSATSRTVGTEVGIATTYTFSRELSFGAGVGYLFAGRFLTESTHAPALWAPYMMWNVKF